MSLDNQFFNTQHAPVGAHASLTLGFPGARGGMDLELCRSPDQSIMIALESASTPDLFEALPFTKAFDAEQRALFVAPDTNDALGDMRLFDKHEVKRDFNVATDSWSAGDLRHTIYSPLRDIPDLERNVDGDPLLGRRELVPAVRAQLAIDNRAGTTTRRAIVGLSRQDPARGLRHLKVDGLVGICDGMNLALACDAPGAWSGISLDPFSVINDTHLLNRSAMLGNWGFICIDVPAGELKLINLAYCFYRGDTATAGMATRYYYTRWFESVEDVAKYALAEFDEAVEASLASNQLLANSALTPVQRFTVAHATRSYLFSTQMLVRDGKPLWVVNEGEYNMINTLDLAADHSLFEMRHHPWTIRNVLDLYVERYSYVDQLRFEGSDQLHPGGLAFNHDMGACCVFAPPACSAYELAGTSGCFSYMSTEEMLNWVLCAGLYIESSKDMAWAHKALPTLEGCFASMLARDHYDPLQRRGILRGDSSRCEDGREITTYDCLDPSLGQASGNTYISGKAFSALLILQHLFAVLGRAELSEAAHKQARMTAAAVIGSVQADGRIPALMTGDQGAIILPVVEGLVYPWFAGCQASLDLNGEYADYFRALQRHIKDHVLQKSGCIFEDGGWRITTHNDNTFPAKVYVCQFAIRTILQLDLKEIDSQADVAHALWQLHPEHSYNCWTEQVKKGVAFAAKYYPRGVSSNIWLSEAAR